MPPVTERVIAGRYNLVETIGRGAMGVVWRARDSLLDRDVAIKEVVLKGAIGDEERENAYRRTMREARTAARLSHHGVVTVYDVAEEDGRPWIIMELVPSRSLDRVLASDGPLPPRRACRVGQQLLAALAAAHAAGVLHRDVKPSNVLIANDPDGERAVLTDFGIAQFAGDPRLTQTGMVMGSPGFTAPERIRGGFATPASDLWSLGATLFAAVQGRGPYEQRGGAITTMSAIINEDAPPASSAGPLAPLIAALLRRDPIARPSAAVAARMFAGVLPLLPEVLPPARRRPALMPPVLPVPATSAAGSTSQDPVPAPAKAPAVTPRIDSPPTSDDPPASKAASTAEDAAPDTTAADERPAAGEAVSGQADGDQSASERAAANPAETEAAGGDVADEDIAGEDMEDADAADGDAGEADAADDESSAAGKTEDVTAAGNDAAGQAADNSASGDQPADAEAVDAEAADAEAADAEAADAEAAVSGLADVKTVNSGAASSAPANSASSSAEVANAKMASAVAGGTETGGDEAAGHAAALSDEEVPPRAAALGKAAMPGKAEGMDEATPVEVFPSPLGSARMEAPPSAPMWNWGQSDGAGEKPWYVRDKDPWEPATKPQPSFGPEPSFGPAPRPRPRGWRRAALAAAAVVLAAAIGTAVALLTRHTPEASGSTSGGAGGGTTAVSQPDAVQAIDNPLPAPPAGWIPVTVPPTPHKTTGGFSIGKPPGWTERQKGLATYLEAPGGLRYMEIDLTKHDRADALAEAEFVEHNAIAQGHLPEYHRVSLQPVTIRGTTGAFWAFTWVTPSGTTMRVDDLLFELSTPSGPQSYAIYFTAPQATFDASAESAQFDRMLRTFATASAEPASAEPASG